MNTIKKDIIEYIKTAEVKSVLKSDVSVNEKDVKDNHFPSFKDIYKYVFKTENSDIFFKNLSKSLDEFTTYIDNPKSTKYKCSINPFKKRIEKSDEVLKKLLNVIKIDVSIDTIPSYDIVKIVTPVYDNDVLNVSKLLIFNLKKLVDKVTKYIAMNNVYTNIYRVEFKETPKKDDSPIQGLTEINNTIESVLNKKFIADFFSDGRDDLEAMLKPFWMGLYKLLELTSPKDSYEYEIDGNLKTNDLDAFLKELLKKHYNSIDESLSMFESMNASSDEELTTLLNELKKVNVEKEIKSTPTEDFDTLGKGEKALYSLIGLEQVKETVKKIKTYIKINKGNKDINLHMAFYGNPGTGKTEVARLIGQILYENKVLPKGHVVEVSRKDLIGQFMGDTPILTNAAIQKAMGGVLFIDEAYSLYQKHHSTADYGEEAIQEILKQMEDHRGEFCVIFAGYTNEMQKMISVNPGLKSRIAFELDFPNYSRDELSQIMKLMLEKKNYTMTEDALNKALDITDVMKKDPNFANARNVRTIIEQTIMCQNLRVNDPDDKVLTIEDVNKYIKDSKIKLPTSGKGKEEKILTADEELDQLVGLENVKKTIKKIKAYANKNKDNPELNLHMCFYGNPGTGKTVVARILSRIFYEAKVLPEAKVKETDKTHFISSFQGESATKTEETVKKSLGGVLFIDEAYSIADGTKGSDEAVSILLKDMEDYRGQFAVIMAGYKKEMAQLLATNPGFDSRVQFKIDFPDYTRDELRRIALFMLKGKSMIITEDALERILDITDYERNNPSFANARTLRNILEQVIMNQNLRTEDELDNKEIIIDDVNSFIEENNIILESESEQIISNDNFINMIKNEISDYDYEYKKYHNEVEFNKLYVEQSVICISSNKSQGTGFIISSSGLALTCAHCIEGDGSNQQARIVFITSDEQKIKSYYPFVVIDKDEFNDIALIRIATDEVKFKYIPLEKEEYEYEPLTKFIMAGYPFGGEVFSSISFTEGSVASVNEYNGREIVFADTFGKSGSSGSPIIDSKTHNIIGCFFGALTHNNQEINSFTPISKIWNLVNRQLKK